MNGITKRKRERKILSCLLCHHKKKKCNKKLPCDQCIARGTSDRCTYQGTLTPPDSSNESAVSETINQSTFSVDENSPRTSISSGPISQSERLPEIECPGSSNVERFLSAFGYSNSQSDKTGLSEIVKEKNVLWDVSETTISAYEFEKLAASLPSKPACEVLVDLFFQKINWHYAFVNRKMFMARLNELFTSRERSSLLAFLGLLYRVLCLSCQMGAASPLPALAGAFPMDMSTACKLYDEMANRVAEKADELQLCLASIQERFLASWYEKNNGRIRKSWIILGTALRLAQVINLGPLVKYPTPEATETARLLWAALRAWDIGMGMSLGRPLTITTWDPKRDLLVMPPTTDPDWQILRQYYEYWNKVAFSVAPTSPDWPVKTSVSAIEAQLDQIEASIDPHLRYSDPDRSMDIRYPQLRVQRVELKIFIESGRANLYLNSLYNGSREGLHKLIVMETRILGLVNEVILHEDMVSSCTPSFYGFDSAFKLGLAVLGLLRLGEPMSPSVLNPIRNLVSMFERLPAVLKNAFRSRAILERICDKTEDQMRNLSNPQPIDMAAFFDPAQLPELPKTWEFVDPSLDFVDLIQFLDNYPSV
uniref:ARAD1A18062p n=1 Tax=Blastobotrys adeninivorans TaxID=409370 RepID=A0A060T3Q8_BLAAD